MNDAIRIAIEKGGYITERFMGSPAQRMVLEPEFWQSLSKALGWGCNCQNGNEYFGPDETGDPIWGPCAVCVSDGQYVPAKDWKDMAHQYLDLVLTGGDVEAFWKGLLNE